jgi:hypothetical protein
MCKEREVLQEMRKTMKWNEIGAALGVSGSLAWQVAKGRCQSPKIRRALGIRKEAVDRLAARVSVDRGDSLRALLEKNGYESITEFWHDVPRILDEDDRKLNALVKIDRAIVWATLGLCGSEDTIKKIQDILIDYWDGRTAREYF